jgi:hypothetical protein
MGMRMGKREGAWEAGYRMAIGNSNDIRTQASTAGCVLAAVVVVVVEVSREGCGKSFGELGPRESWEERATAELLLYSMHVVYSKYGAAGLRRSLSERIATVLVVRPSLFFSSSSVLPLFFLVSRPTGCSRPLSVNSTVPRIGGLTVYPGRADR